MYQLDVDTAIVLKDFKGVNLQQNIDKLIPEVLAQQIDNHVLSKYFDLLDLASTSVSTWDATVDWTDTRVESVMELYRDLGSVSMKMGEFTRKTGVVPNILLCDPYSINILRQSFAFVPHDPTEDIDYSGTPQFAGTFGTAKVYIVNYNPGADTEARIVITHKGKSDAQSAAVYAPFIPVTLRTINGAEGNGMITTNNIYSISGFSFINPELVMGVKNHRH